mmetsp:Transcript_24910/g.53772  ORF Transcript_24910/g.53772 Transcript_24910/m.53772 type:complete len:91 (+) Transcript_24910:1254-1526(+)
MSEWMHAMLPVERGGNKAFASVCWCASQSCRMQAALRSFGCVGATNVGSSDTDDDDEPATKRTAAAAPAASPAPAGSPSVAGFAAWLCRG